MRPNIGEFVAVGRDVAAARCSAWRGRPSRPARAVSLIDIAAGIAEGLPSGVYARAGIEQYLDGVLAERPDRVNDFRKLERELYLTATDLDTCERIVLGGEEWDDVSIAKAVSASTALPMVYKPVEINGRAADRRRHPLDDQRRHRGRARRQVHRRRQPAGPVRQRLPEADPDRVRQQGAPRRRHGVRPDRLPDLQAARPPAAARGRQPLEGALSRRRHRADRAGARTTS